MGIRGFSGNDINPHLVKDLQFRLRTKDLFEWIETQAETLSSTCPADDQVEFNADIYRSRKIRNVSPENLVGAATIRPATGDQYDIYYNQFYKDKSLPRWRFAVAHELGHTFWFAPGGGARPLSPVQWKMGRDPSIEYLCDRFASAFLLPRRRVDQLVKKLCLSLDIPLHAIPAVSATYQVPDRAVARRLFFEQQSVDLAIVCLRKAGKINGSASQRWQTHWCEFSASPSKGVDLAGFRIPLSAPNRVIPDDMIPEIPYGGTHPIELDGRWWQLLKLKPNAEARLPFARHTTEPARVAYASQIGGKFYLGLPGDRRF